MVALNVKEPTAKKYLMRARQQGDYFGPYDTPAAFYGRERFGVCNRCRRPEAARGEAA